MYKKIREFFPKMNKVTEPIIVTILIAVIGFIFYMFAYLFLYGYYFKNEKSIMDAIINPIPMNNNSLIFIGVIISLIIMPMFILGKKLYNYIKENNNKKTYLLSLLVFIALYIVFLLFVSFLGVKNNIYSVTLRLVIYVFFILLTMLFLYNYKIIDLFFCFIATILINFTIFIISTYALKIKNFKIEKFITESKMYYLFVLLLLISLAINKKYKIFFSIYCIIGYYTLKFSTNINFTDIWLFIAFIAFVLIFIFLIMWIINKKIICKLNFNGINKDNSSIRNLIENLKELFIKYLTPFLSMLLAVILLASSLLVLTFGNLVSDFVELDLIEIQYTDSNDNLNKVNGKIISFKDGYYYIATANKTLLVIYNNKISINNLESNNESQVKN